MPDSLPGSQLGIAAALDDLIKSPGERVTLEELMDKLGGRAFAFLTLVLSLPNAVGLGAIPGVSTVFGIPQVLLALQRALGYRNPWFPQRLMGWSIARADLERVTGRATGWLHKAERIMRPRWPALASPAAERLLAVVIALLAVLIALPLPLANLPPAVAIAILSLGLIARDGVVIAVGLAASLFATALAAGVMFGAVQAVLALANGLFG
ncbi:MAG: exopolysaccharide biosynthesis protein [Alphaproteobacteria bacterium]|nr:exopolysaccharide biosynthesis protein [Alphaproteobacteria bacterium]